nr:hypothetical protein [Allomuricauda sp.]
MKLIAVLKQIGLKKLGRLFVLGLKNIPYVIPTFLATKDCIRLSTRFYDQQHYENGPANAFRHALWNYLIAKRCFSWWKSETKVVEWAKNITDWHEEAFPNKSLAKKMDLHNNRVGRIVYRNHKDQDQDEVVQLLRKMTHDSVKINLKTELGPLEKQLVHIIETK